VTSHGLAVASAVLVLVVAQPLSSALERMRTIEEAETSTSRVSGSHVAADR
jgi:hypothetical protein